MGYGNIFSRGPRHHVKRGVTAFSGDHGDEAMVFQVRMRARWTGYRMFTLQVLAQVKGMRRGRGRPGWG